MNIKEIPWLIDPHTSAKHEILRKYLQPWMAILSTANRRIIYLDGFAGPGEYLTKKGEKVDGSPIIAINCYLEHKFKQKIKEVCFIFVDKEKEVIEYLDKKLKKYSKENLKIETIHAEFEVVVNHILNKLEKDDKNIAPTFCFIDPFGIKGLSLNTISRIINKKSCEVFINFMYEELIRFISLPQNEKNVCALFGEESKWKEVKNYKTPKERYLFLVSLYEEQLRNSCEGECYIRTFNMVNKFNKNDYVLFFVTKSKLGLKKMKEAMWTVDERGEFTFSDFTYDPNQSVLFSNEPDYNRLQKEIVEEFKFKKVDVEEIFDYVLIKTSFLDKHARFVLTKMEEDKKISVERNGQNRRGAFPSGKTIIDFNNLNNNI